MQCAHGTDYLCYRVFIDDGDYRSAWRSLPNGERTGQPDEHFERLGRGDGAVVEQGLCRDLHLDPEPPALSHTADNSLHSQLFHRASPASHDDVSQDAARPQGLLVKAPGDADARLRHRRLHGLRDTGRHHVNVLRVRLLRRQLLRQGPARGHRSPTDC